jgi:hypothetical protein
MLKVIKPNAKVGKQAIDVMRRWSSDNARNVSKCIETQNKKKSSSKLNLRESQEEVAI